MFTVKSSALELRGVANRTSPNNKAYQILNVEDVEGNPYALYCPEISALPVGLKKGDNVYVTFDVKYYKGNERLIVRKVEKV